VLQAIRKAIGGFDSLFNMKYSPAPKPKSFEFKMNTGLSLCLLLLQSNLSAKGI
jgi:hypothetical protein